MTWSGFTPFCLLPSTFDWAETCKVRRMNKTAFLRPVPLLVCALFFFGCSGDDEIPVPEDGDKILGPLQPGEERIYHPNSENPDYIIVKMPDGSERIVIVDDLNKWKPTGDAGIVPRPGEVGRTEPYPGASRDIEVLDVPEDRVPSEVLRPLPAPIPPSTTYTDEMLREIERRAAEEREKAKRYVVENEETIDGVRYTVIRIFDGNGKLIAKHRKAGRWTKGLPNETTGEKTVVTDNEDSLQWIVFDYVTGRLIVESRFGLAKLDDIVDIETAGGNIIVITKIRNGSWIRVRVFGADGTLQHTIDLPGEYKKSITNGANVKALIGEHNGITYQDLVMIASGTVAGVATGATGHADNGLKGQCMDIEFYKKDPVQRFIIAVYNPDRDETTVRIMDENGTLVSTQILKGKFIRARVIRERKVFLTDWKGDTETTVIDPVGGRITHVETVRGKSTRRITDNGNGTVTVHTDQTAQSMSLDGP